MTAPYRFRILNVFAIEGDRFSGNPLCVVEDGRGLSEAQMQALALQFNLSETTYVLPSERATARVRIFTPAFELPFAGHPTLGTAHVVRALKQCGDAVSLEEKAGVIPVTARGDTWTLTANAPRRRPAEANRLQLADMLGLDERDVGDGAAWIDTGTEQLVVPLTSATAVAECCADAELLGRFGRAGPDRCLVYAWAPGDGDTIHARFFFNKGAAVVEDPATGSACANLGGWLVTTGAKRPIARTVLQGRHLGRPSKLSLAVDAGGTIQVSGLVTEIAQGTLTV